MQEASYDMTQQAMADPRQGAKNGDETLYVKFENVALQDNVASQEQGRPIFRDVAFINIQAPGNKDSIIRREVRPGDAERFPVQWAAFNKDEEQVQNGTPLEAWPAITRAMVEELRHFKIYTVDQLAGMSLSNLQNFHGGVNLQERAKLFLKAAEGTAPLEALKAKNDEQANIIETMKRQIQELQSQFDAEKAARPKRGRPPKE